jgi:hypothetical protein
LVPVYQTTCCHITKSCSLHTHPVENLKSHNVWNTYLGTALGALSDWSCVGISEGWNIK